MTTPDPSPAEWVVLAQQSSAKWSAAARQRVATERLGITEIASANDLQLIAAAAHAHMEVVRSW